MLTSKALFRLLAFAPDECQSLNNFVVVAKLPKGLLILDKGGFAYTNPTVFHDSFAQDVDPAQANIIVVVQKPPNLSILAESSGLPACKQLLTWYQVSENDRMIRAADERLFAKQMNATTISLLSSHAPFVSHPNEIALTQKTKILNNSEWAIVHRSFRVVSPYMKI